MRVCSPRVASGARGGVRNFTMSFCTVRLSLTCAAKPSCWDWLNLRASGRRLQSAGGGALDTLIATLAKLEQAAIPRAAGLHVVVLDFVEL